MIQTLNRCDSTLITDKTHYIDMVFDNTRNCLSVITNDNIIDIDNASEVNTVSQIVKFVLHAIMK